MEQNRQNHSSTVTDFYDAIIKDDSIVVKTLLEYNPFLINVVDEYGATPLHEAVSYGRKNIIQLLISAGSNLEARDRYGRTPLYNAVIHGHVNATEVLLSAGAEINTKDNMGETLLHSAPYEEPLAADVISVVKLLITEGIDVNATNKIGHTALHEAMRCGDRDMVKLLSSSGANV